MPKGKIKICRTISWLGDCSLSPTTPKNVMFNNLMQFNTKPSQHKWKDTFDIMDNHNKNIDASNSVTWYQMYVLWFDHFLMQIYAISRPIHQSYIHSTSQQSNLYSLHKLLLLLCLYLRHISNERSNNVCLVT